MTKEMQALIEAAERMIASQISSNINDHVQAMANLLAAISSAKAAEEEVETRYVVEVRSPHKRGANWDRECDSLKEAKEYMASVNSAESVCTIIGLEKRRFSVREKEGL